ncbi:IS110 family RNA-guided transposase [Dactylosporangium darangshiense]|uniref:IS110 family transposase n=1 Tax=Dactylosporangium darangshiense TaxID=579108 RepID=A0ABP8DUC8_9ACTN
MQRVARAWAGIDAGKGHHHVVVIDSEGQRLLSRKVANDEPALAALMAAVLTRAETVTWAIDLADGPAALAITFLLDRGQRVLFVPGVAVNRMSGAYRGEGKTDAKDAAVIADQARMRRDLRELHLDEPLIAELRMLTAHRADLAGDRTRNINRLRIRLLGIFPALERALDFTNRGPLVLISQFQTPAAILETGQRDLALWLRQRQVRNADKLATVAMRAAETQQTRVAGDTTAGELIAQLATTVLELDRQLAELDKLIAERFHSHRHAKVITSMVGIGDLLGAEFLAATGGSLDGFASADQLAGYAGLAPTPRDSGKRVGNLHRPKRYNRQLQRVFYTSALISIQRSHASRTFYDRKRADGKRHTQAVLALARRRVNVLWAMLRDSRPYQERHSTSLAA